MTAWASGLPSSPQIEELAAIIDGDQNVAGVALTGSWAHGMATKHSDVDLCLILRKPSDAWRRTRVDGLDIELYELSRLRDVPKDPGRWWDRYSMVRAEVVLDRLDGEIGDLFARWGRLSDEETQIAIDYYMDPYLTYLDRCLRAHRVQLTLAAHLDAVEGLAWAVRLMFALNQRVPPTNKYLSWELERFPFEELGWAPEVLLDLVMRILVSGDQEAVRTMFALFQPVLRRHGFGGALNLWDETVALAQDLPRVH